MFGPLNNYVLGTATNVFQWLASDRSYPERAIAVRRRYRIAPRLHFGGGLVRGEATFFGETLKARKRDHSLYANANHIHVSSSIFNAGLRPRFEEAGKTSPRELSLDAQ